MRDEEVRARTVTMGLSLGDETWGKISELRSLWQFYGRSMNLTARLDEHALNTHIVESLQAVALASRLAGFEHWLDIGSGAGFPGLVIAACMGVRVTCVEPRAKRASFLEIALRKLGRADCRVARGRIESGHWVGIEGSASPELGDVASARAVFEPRRWMEEARPWVRPGGVIVVHMSVVDPDLEAELVGRVDGERWSIRGYRV
ncbi:16S rRNA (guanine(527)-N(7))-methyltransferase RsmG [Nannocystaceae bacterium ST9]